MLNTGALTDVTLSASGTSVKAHRLVLASCSQYFAQLFKEVEADNTLVVVLGCDAAELKLLLTFMYTGEVTASRVILPSLLRLAQTLKVSGLTDADAQNTTQADEPDANQEETNSPINLEIKNEPPTPSVANENSDNSKFTYDEIQTNDVKERTECNDDFIHKSERDRLSKLDQIVQNLYKIGNPTTAANVPSIVPEPDPYDRKWRMGSSVCTICNKRLSNQYNLRVHMETHAGRRHACRACSHVSRSRDALRKHVAYRHAPHQPRPRADL
ncbi:protein abrupt isoform X2 [Manduca sexta]|uniref:Uncharacterized protein n=2 Tax=Manduca sexta TaxID=7130 RepID=A0A921YU17_MANSE|nr:protein abrupt isoform X2 [Manduca sexta]XP_030020666.1 protein abrupt isoform X2 [Manduca sexta]XP_030020667.1 protein abrupt isoform X2 [Manduca sexta]KAG6445541.1 hypothetical protein O3G_MSEX003960 [Manduca sexta]KAG6445542.1 hypothetical protein O3G_MSEX003960 [Manduca sexta]